MQWDDDHQWPSSRHWHLSLEDPFHAEEGSSDPLGGHMGEVEASAIQIQRVKSPDKIMYIPAAGKNTHHIHLNNFFLFFFSVLEISTDTTAETFMKKN